MKKIFQKIQRAAEQTKILYSKSDGKQVDWSGYSYKARKIVRKNLRGRLVRMRSAVQICLAAPNNRLNAMFKRFLFSSYHIKLFRDFPALGTRLGTKYKENNGSPGICHTAIDTGRPAIFLPAAQERLVPRGVCEKAVLLDRPFPCTAAGDAGAFYLPLIFKLRQTLRRVTR